MTPRQEEDITCPTTHRPSDAYGDFALTVNCSGARTSAWHDKLTQFWLMLIRMSGWSAPAETPHLVLGSGKRPDISAPREAIRRYYSTFGPAPRPRLAMTPWHAALPLLGTPPTPVRNLSRQLAARELQLQLSSGCLSACSEIGPANSPRAAQYQRSR